MKTFFQGWGSTIFVAVVILGLGILPVIQSISHSTEQLHLQQELLEIHQINGQLNVNNAVMELQLDHANELLDQQHDIIRNMYEQLKQWENLPPFPEEEGKPRPNRSDA